MRDKIQEYIDGKFNDSCPEIGLSPSAIKECVEEGSVFSGDFFLTCTPDGVESISGEDINGQVFCNDLRVSLSGQTFTGKAWTVPYEISLDGLQVGDVLQGEMEIITNFGEYSLPYEIVVGQTAPRKEEKPVKNLFHFANLAREEWESAVSFFRKTDFINLLVNNDRQYRNLYRVLTKDGASEQTMDEFLVAVHKKERVSLWLEKSEDHLYPVHLEEEHFINITKESWGYIEASVSCDKGSFIKLRKNTLTRDDFIGNSCQIPYTILKEQLHPGVNQDAVIIHTAHQVLRYELTVEAGKSDALWEIEQTLLKYRIQFWELYMSFRKKDITSGFWVEQSLGLIDKILELDSENREWQLMKVQLLLLGKRESEGKILLEAFEKGKVLKETDQILYGYYLYLQACYKKDAKQTKKTTEELWKMYRQNGEPFAILWMLLYLDEEMETNLLKKWELLKEQYKKGCASPMLYMEALQLLKKDESLLNKLGNFEIHLLLFALKRSAFKNKWLDRILSFSVKNNQFHPLLFKLYKECYQLSPGKDWLATIVGLLVRSGKSKKEYLEWYEMGVNQNLNIAGIFEKFVNHLEYRERKKLPRSVVEYYAHSTDGLRDEQKALLYSLVSEYGLLGVPKLGNSLGRYEKLIHFYIKEQLLQGKFNENLAKLYNEHLDEEILSEEKALEKCGEFLFIRQIKSKWKNIRKVLVAHENLSAIEEYPFEDGQAMVPVYSGDDVIVLVDEKGRKYAQVTDYNVKIVWDYRKFSPYFKKDVRQPLGLLIHTEIDGQRYRNISPENQYNLEIMAKDNRFTKEFRMELSMALLEYYQSSFQSGKLRKALEEVEIGAYSAFERSKILEMLLGEGLYEIAYPVICKYGFDYVDSRMLVGILSDRILETDFEKQEDLVKLCFQVVKKGKYTENMLEYLARHYNGGLIALKEVWELVQRFGLDSAILSERILNRILFMGGTTADYQEIFCTFTEQKGHSPLTYAYLSLESYYYFVKDKKVGMKTLEILEQQLRKAQELPWVCKLAFLKSCVAKGNLEERTKNLAYKVLMEALRKGQIFSFFKELDRILDKDLGFENQVIVEYKTRPGSKVWLHYLLETDGTGEERYITESMENDFEGIFTRSFTLFYGERLQYYITEGTADHRHFKENRTLCIGSENFYHRERRLQMINDIMVSVRMEDQKSLFSMLDKYVSMDYLVEQLYKRL